MTTIAEHVCQIVLGQLLGAACIYVLFWRRDTTLERYMEAVRKEQEEAARIVQ